MVVVVDTDDGVELDGVGDTREGVVVVDEEPPPVTDSASSESSLSYSTASLP